MAEPSARASPGSACNAPPAGPEMLVARSGWRRSWRAQICRECQGNRVVPRRIIAIRAVSVRDATEAHPEILEVVAERAQERGRRLVVDRRADGVSGLSPQAPGFILEFRQVQEVGDPVEKGFHRRGELSDANGGGTNHAG